MSKERFEVGVDVGQSEVWASLGSGKPRKFKHDETGVKQLYRWAKEKSGELLLHFCMEATGVYSQSLAVRLLGCGRCEVSIVNPAQIAAYAKAQMRRSKTDQIDAQVIWAFAQAQQPRCWQPERQAIQELAALVTQADALQKTQRSWKNRQHAHQYRPALPSMVQQTSTVVEETLKQQLEMVQKEIHRLCQNDAELKRDVNLLCTIPGVAELTATRLLAYGKSALTERSPKELTAHAGLAPRHRQSGTSLNGRSRLSKQGDARIRCMLYMPTVTATIFNPIIKYHYQRHLANHKPPMVALMASMKKLLLMAQAILISQQPFNPNLKPLT